MPVTAPDREVAVVIPAAGSGKRLGGMRKQFRVLGDAPLLVQTLRVFEVHPEIDKIVLAAPAEDAETLFAEFRSAGITKLVSVVPGGETRQASVMRALKALPETAVIVLVHDGVRPFVSSEAITRTIAAVEAHGAASLAIEVADTLRRGEGGFFADSIDRTGVYRMQTPQGFRRSLLIDAYDRAAAENWEATDDVEVVRSCGHRVAIVPGDDLNIKITSPADWELAQFVWRERTAAQS